MYRSLDIPFLTFLTSMTVVGVIAIEVKVLHDSKDVQSVCMTGKALSFLFSLHCYKWTFTDTAVAWRKFLPQSFRVVTTAKINRQKKKRLFSEY